MTFGSPRAQSYAAITEAMLDGREADGADADADADADGDVAMDDARDGDAAAGQADGVERGGDGGAEEGAADGRGGGAADGGGPGGARGGSPREGSPGAFGAAGSVLGVVVPRQLRTSKREPRQPQARRAPALRSRPCAALGRRQRARSADPASQAADQGVLHWRLAGCEEGHELSCSSQGLAWGADACEHGEGYPTLNLSPPYAGVRPRGRGQPPADGQRGARAARLGGAGGRGAGARAATAAGGRAARGGAHLGAPLPLAGGRGRRCAGRRGAGCPYPAACSCFSSTSAAAVSTSDGVPLARTHVTLPLCGTSLSGHGAGRRCLRQTSELELQA